MVSAILERKYDLVLLGATGYTATICAEQITKTYPIKTRWAVAGRSEATLTKLTRNLKTLNPDRTPPGKTNVPVSQFMTWGDIRIKRGC